MTAIPDVLLRAHAEALRWPQKSPPGVDAIRKFQVLAGDYVCRLIDESKDPTPPAGDLFAECYAKLAKAVANAGYHINTKDGEMYLTPKSAPEASGADYVLVPRAQLWGWFRTLVISPTAIKTEMADLLLDNPTTSCNWPDCGHDTNATGLQGCCKLNPAPPTSWREPVAQDTATKLQVAMVAPADESGASADWRGFWAQYGKDYEAKFGRPPEYPLTTHPNERVSMTYAQYVALKLGTAAAEPRAAGQEEASLDVRILARDVHYAIADDGLAPLSPVDNNNMREAILRVLIARLQPSGAAEDAARYRWLREQNANLDNPDAWTITCCDFTDEEGPSRYWVGSDLDAAIDAARRARGESNG